MRALTISPVSQWELYEFEHNTKPGNSPLQCAT
jgi:hypothetical protein